MCSADNPGGIGYCPILGRDSVVVVVVFADVSLFVFSSIVCLCCLVIM